MAGLDAQERGLARMVRKDSKMTKFDLSKVLEQKETAISQVRLTVLDRRSLEQTQHDTYIFGEFFCDKNIRKELDRVGYDLVSSELIDTQYGHFSLKGIFDAFTVASEEK